MTSENFKYTDNGRFLTSEQRQFYEDNGFLMFRNLISGESLDEYRQRFVDICDGKVEPGGMIVMKDHVLKKTTAEGEFLINKIQEFVYDDVLFKFVDDKVVTKIVSSIIGEDITAVNSMLINKPPDSKPEFSRHPMHQDLYYFPFRPADKICASWTAMERIDEKNGCLFAIPGSHKLKLLAHVYPDKEKNPAYHGVQGFDDVPTVNFVMEKGDTLFFHPSLLHGSGPNLTKGFRKAISVHYANSNCHFIDVRGTVQQNIAAEVEEIIKRKGLEFTYEDGWRLKSRHVSGRPGNFQFHQSHFPKFRYTDNACFLTDDQRQFYEDNGYIMFRKLVSDKSLEEYRERFVDICHGRVSTFGVIVVKDLALKNTDVKGEYLINKIQEFLYDDVLFKYASDETVANIVSSIIGNDVRAMHSMLINKPPDSSYEYSRHPLHQDLYYFPFRPADQICATWTAMERIDEKNGCLFAVAGSHKTGLHPHVYPDEIQNPAYYGIQGFDHLPKVNLTMEKGDTVFFHPLLFHGSGQNLTKGFRKAISVHYANSNCHFIDLKGTVQEGVVEEVEGLMKKKGIHMKYEDYWKIKSRQIYGRPGNFQRSSHL